MRLGLPSTRRRWKRINSKTHSKVDKFENGKLKMIVFVWTEIKICVYYRLRLQSPSCWRGLSCYFVKGIRKIVPRELSYVSAFLKKLEMWAKLSPTARASIALSISPVFVQIPACFWVNNALGEFIVPLSLLERKFTPAWVGYDPRSLIGYDVSHLNIFI